MSIILKKKNIILKNIGHYWSPWTANTWLMALEIAPRSCRMLYYACKILAIIFKLYRVNRGTCVGTT